MAPLGGQQQRGQRGADKPKDTVSKPPKTSKHTGGDPLTKDIRYYAKKLAGSLTLEEPTEGGSEIEGEPTAQGNMEDAVPGCTTHSATAAPAEGTEENSEEEEEKQAQPILAKIVRAVNKCAASVNTLQEHFGGLKEEVSIIRQDIQKNQGENHRG